MKYIAGVLVLFLSFGAYANSMGPVVAKVTGTGTYDDGAIYIFFDRAVSSCTAAGRLDLSSTHPAKDQVLSLAMTAFASGKSVKVHPGSCNGSTPEFGSVGDSYLYLTNEEPN